MAGGWPIKAGQPLKIIKIGGLESFKRAWGSIDLLLANGNQAPDGWEPSRSLNAPYPGGERLLPDPKACPP